MSPAGAVSPGRRGLISPRGEQGSSFTWEIKRKHAGNVTTEPRRTKPRSGAHAVVIGVAELLRDLALCGHPVGTVPLLGPAQVRRVISLGRLGPPAEEGSVAMDTDAPRRRPARAADGPAL